ncbi:uncharacterized protein LOC144990999 isoform X2 [Oryzias latipes]
MKKMKPLQVLSVHLVEILLNDEAGSPKVRSCICFSNKTITDQEVKCQYLPKKKETAEPEKKRKRASEDKTHREEERRKKREDSTDKVTNGEMSPAEKKEEMEQEKFLEDSSAAENHRCLMENFIVK